MHIIQHKALGVMLVLAASMAQADKGGDAGASSAPGRTAQKAAGKASGNSKKTGGQAGVVPVLVKPVGKTDPVWGELPEQRALRLRRECKGRPNAGACEGFAN